MAHFSPFPHSEQQLKLQGSKARPAHFVTQLESFITSQGDNSHLAYSSTSTQSIARQNAPDVFDEQPIAVTVNVVDPLLVDAKDKREPDNHAHALDGCKLSNSEQFLQALGPDDTRKSSTLSDLNATLEGSMLLKKSKQLEIEQHQPLKEYLPGEEDDYWLSKILKSWENDVLHHQWVPDPTQVPAFFYDLYNHLSYQSGIITTQLKKGSPWWIPHANILLLLEYPQTVGVGVTAPRSVCDMKSGRNNAHPYQTVPTVLEQSNHPDRTSSCNTHNQNSEQNKDGSNSKPQPHSSTVLLRTISANQMLSSIAPCSAILHAVDPTNGWILVSALELRPYSPQLLSHLFSFHPEKNASTTASSRPLSPLIRETYVLPCQFIASYFIQNTPLVKQDTNFITQQFYAQTP